MAIHPEVSVPHLSRVPGRMTLVVSLLLASAAAAAEPAVLSAPLVPFGSAESMTRLEQSRHKADFFTLVNHFEGQQNGGMCGPTSAVIVLNALRAQNTAIEKPRDERLFPAEYRSLLPAGIDPVFRCYSQGTFIDARFESVKPRDVFYGRPPAPGQRPDPGLQLRQLHSILEKHGVQSTLRVVDGKMDLEAIRAELRANLARADDYVIVNYWRPALGQQGGGHHSPLGAYHEGSDSFLILDVNPNGKTWVWVSTVDLVLAMRTPDRDENRGYLLLREGVTAPTP